MYVRTKYRLPDRLQTGAFIPEKDIDPNDEWAEFDRVPEHLTTLEKADFPEEVKTTIVKLYKAIGVENPLKQKIVEPTGSAFNGDYDKMLMYFRWEAQTHEDNREQAEELQAQAFERYGHIFNHYAVYEL